MTFVLGSRRHVSPKASPIEPEAPISQPVKATNRPLPDVCRRSRALALRARVEPWKKFVLKTSWRSAHRFAFFPRGPASAAGLRFLRASAARSSKPCDSPHVSARDAFDRQLHPVHYSRVPALSVDPASVEGLASPAESRGLAFHDAHNPLRYAHGDCLRRCECSLLAATPRCATSDAPVALPNRTRPALSRSHKPARPEEPKTDSSRELVKDRKPIDPRRLPSPGGLLSESGFPFPEIRNLKQTGLSPNGFATTDDNANVA